MGRVVREVLWARPQSRGTDIGAALEYLTGVQRRRATVFLVSDFLTRDYKRQLSAAARRHDIIAIRVREPLDHVGRQAVAQPPERLLLFGRARAPRFQRTPTTARRA